MLGRLGTDKKMVDGISVPYVVHWHPNIPRFPEISFQETILNNIPRRKLPFISIHMFYPKMNLTNIPNQGRVCSQILATWYPTCRTSEPGQLMQLKPEGIQRPSPSTSWWFFTSSSILLHLPNSIYLNTRLYWCIPSKWITPPVYINKKYIKYNYPILIYTFIPYWVYLIYILFNILSNKYKVINILYCIPNITILYTHLICQGIDIKVDLSGSGFAFAPSPWICTNFSIQNK